MTALGSKKLHQPKKDGGREPPHPFLTLSGNLSKPEFQEIPVGYKMTSRNLLAVSAFSLDQDRK
jgi:hypothetical protein